MKPVNEKQSLLEKRHRSGLQINHSSACLNQRMSEAIYRQINLQWVKTAVGKTDKGTMSLERQGASLVTLSTSNLEKHDNLLPHSSVDSCHRGLRRHSSLSVLSL